MSLLAKQYHDRTFLALFDLQSEHFENNPKKESAFFIVFPLSDSRCEVKKEVSAKNKMVVILRIKVNNQILNKRFNFFIKSEMIRDT